MKWEYCFVQWKPRRSGEPEAGYVGKLKFIGVNKSERLQDDEIDAIIARLGLEGWEMISHTAAPPPPQLQIVYFKRPVEG